MNLSGEGLALIKRFEGFSAKPYLCPGGHWTIGYGHVLKSLSQTETSLSMTQSEAGSLLLQDVVTAEKAVRRLLPVPLTQGQFDALVSFTYNLGAGALQRSTLRQKILRREHQQAVQEFQKWVFAGGRKVPGLVKRRAAEAFLYQNAENDISQ